MYYFWKKDCEAGLYVDKIRAAKQEIQRFIYAINQPYCRNGIQSAFTNTSIFDHPYLEALFGGATFPDGSFMVDEIEGIMDFQKLFLETMAEIREKNMMTFPVNTISLLRQNGKFVDEDFARWACEHNRKWNDSNLFVDSSVTSLSNCCRLRNSLKDIGYFDSQNELEDTVIKEMYNEYVNGNIDAPAGYTIEQFKSVIITDETLNKTFKERIRAKRRDKDSGLGWFSSIGGTALKVGSCKVSTINLARLAYENDTEEDYLNALENLCNLNYKVLDVQRSIIKRNVDKGLLKNFQVGLVDFEHLYSTCGVIGVYEAIKSFGYVETDKFGNTYYTKEADEFGRKIFDVIHRTKDEFMKHVDYKINVEQIPGETAAVKLQKKDIFFFPDKVVTDLPLYGNQFIPLGIKTTLQERIRIAALFDSYCNGGSILHVGIEAPFNSFDQAWEMLNYVADQGVTYFAFTTKIQACKHNHSFFGKVCPICGEPVETEYSRIVG